MSDIVKVEEYKEAPPIPRTEITDDDLDYLEKSFRSKQSNSFTINWTKNGNVQIRNTSYAGIIQLENIRIHFSTKVKTNLFYMLSFLKSEDNFVFDPFKAIEIEGGGSFFDILARLFLNELEEIINHGLLKKYVVREENLDYLKGKLLFNEQIKQNLLIQPKFYCKYHDLTHDNLENQIILRATNLLIPMISFNEELRYDLIRLERSLKEDISLNIGLSQRDCDFVMYDRLNQHYETIIDFSGLIFREHFIRSTHKGESRGFNFIVNMNKVYEDFVTEMIKEVIRDDRIFSDYAVVSQLPFDTLVKEKNIITKPDIILKNKTNDEYPLIIDAKYKRYESNADFYQMIAYSLAIKKSKKCCLIYPKSDNKGADTEYTVVRDVLNEKSDTIKLYTKSISLFENGEEEFKQFIERIKEEEIQPMLKSLLDL